MYNRLNGGGKMVEQAAPKPTHFLTPGSPRSARRGSSPLPTGPTHQRTSRKKSEHLLGSHINVCCLATPPFFDLTEVTRGENNTHMV